jgi:hypothetical protein
MSSAVTVALLAIMIVGGTGLRFVHLYGGSGSYMRPHWAALQARDHELRLGGNASGFDASVIHAASEPEIEPPMMQWITAIGWRTTGTESLLLPAAIAILSWAIGGVFIFRLLREIASDRAGLVGVAVWMFLPYATEMSRRFLPDVPMIACVAAAIFYMVRADATGSRRDRWIAVAVSAFAIFTKLQAVFFILAVSAALEIPRGGLRALARHRYLSFVGMVLAPSIAYYGLGLTIGSWLGGQSQGRIEPALLLTGSYWRNWYQLDATMFGLGILALGLFGVAIARGRALWIAGALWGGTIAFALTFSFHYSTHNYYHLGMVLVLSVSIGLGLDRVSSALDHFSGRRFSAAVNLALAAVTVVLLMEAGRESIFPVVPAQVAAETLRDRRSIPRRVGTWTRHSTRVVWIAPAQGTPLMFYGGIAGIDWNEVRRQYRSDASALSAIRRSGSYDYFAVIDAPERLGGTLPIRELLRAVPLIASGPKAAVYDLRPR